MSFRSWFKKLPLSVVAAGGLLALTAPSTVAPPIFAQVASASLTGNVSDPSHAAIAGATVTALNTGTGLSQSVTTNEGGNYTFTTLQPGTYTISVTYTGFETKTHDGLQLSIGQAATLNTVLTVGSSSETITVQASGDLINQSTAEISQLVGEESVKELPLNGRDPSSLVLLAPGITNILSATAPGGGSTGAGYLQTTNAFPTESGASANGGRQGSTYYLLDSVSNMDTYLLLAAPFPNADATQEFRVITNNFDARYGFAPGAVVSIETKSGTNDFHGGVFEFLRNSALNAGNYFSHSVDSLKRNQFGGFVGGPIEKNKLFFFANYQQTQASTTPATNTTETPTAAMLAGDFSAVPLTLSAPFTTINGKPNQINPALFDTASVAIAGLVPLGVVPASGEVTFTGAPQRYSYKEATGRLDYDLTGTQRLSVRNFLYWLDQPEQTINGNTLTNTIGQRGRLYNELITHTWTISPTTVNVLSGAWLQNDFYSAAHVTDQNGQPVCLSQFIAVSDPAGTCYIEGGVQVSNAFSQLYTSPNTEDRRNWTIDDDFTKVMGAHTITAGINAMRQLASEVSAYPANANVSFTGQYTGFGLADFLLGYAHEMRQGAGEIQDPKGIVLGLYAQDAWKINPRLTLTAGVRWEPNLPPTVSSGRGAAFIPGEQSARYPNAPTGLVFPGDPGVDSSLMPHDYAQFAPRIGVAWQPSSLPKTVFRGAFGMFFGPLEFSQYNHTADISPFSPTYDFSGTTSAYIPFSTPWSYAGSGTGGANPFPPFASSSFNPPATSTFPDPVSVLAVFARDFKQSTTQSWNLSVEQQFSATTALHLAYVGSQSYHLVFPWDLNPGIYNTNPALNGIRTAYTAFGPIYQNTSAGTANYNSLQAGLNVRIHNSLQVQSNFTWSRSEDVFTGNSVSFSYQIPDPFDFKFNYGKSDLNIPLISVTNFVYTSPALKGRNALVHQILGSWQVSGLYTMQSGLPFSIDGGNGNNNSASQQSGDRADFSATAAQISPGVHQGNKAHWLNEYFNTARFVTNAPGTFGNTPRNIYQGPGINTADLGFFKNWSYQDRFRLQFRWEMFNAFNRPSFSNPNADPSSGNFGQITAIGPIAPRVQQAGLKLMF